MKNGNAARLTLAVIRLIDFCIKSENKGQEYTDTFIVQWGRSPMYSDKCKMLATPQGDTVTVSFMGAYAGTIPLPLVDNVDTYNALVVGFVEVMGQIYEETHS